MSEFTEIKPLTESMKQGLGERLRDHVIKIFTWSWNFSKWYEKLIIVILFGWGIYSLIKFGKSLIW